jgi:NAD(P)-dependent dehydrogenase (short-subunit alcohol dehydrogenase family)
VRVGGKVVVVTGAGSGIGAALCRRFADEGARAVVVTDRDGPAAELVAAELSGATDAVADPLDVTDPHAVTALVRDVEARFGALDLFCSNAGMATGIGLGEGDAADALWQAAFDVHVMAHVYAARAVLPGMLARGGGYLLNTASAAGLLASPGDAPYTVSKHGAVALAEWLAITYGGRGIGVSVLCPLGVATPLLIGPLAAGEPGARAVAASGEILTAEQVADAVVDGLAAERFLILPHPQVGRFWAQKAADPDRWLAGVRRLVESDEVERQD